MAVNYYKWGDKRSVGNKMVYIRAKGSIGDSEFESLKMIMDDAGISNVTITSIERTIEEQVSVMHYNYKTQGLQSQLDLYGSKGDEVVNDIHNYTLLGLPKAEIIKVVSAKHDDWYFDHRTGLNGGDRRVMDISVREYIASNNRPKFPRATINKMESAIQSLKSYGRVHSYIHENIGGSSEHFHIVFNIIEDEKEESESAEEVKKEETVSTPKEPRRYVPWNHTGNYEGMYVEDLLKDINFIGYGNEVEDVLDFAHEGVSNRRRLYDALSLEQKKLYNGGSQDFSESVDYPIMGAVTLYVPVENVKASTSVNIGEYIYSSNITIMRSKEAHYYPEIMKRVSVDPRYTSRNYGDKAKSIYPRLRVYAWSRTKWLEGESGYVDVTAYVINANTSSNMGGSEFSVTLAPTIGKLFEQNDRYVWSPKDVLYTSSNHRVSLGNVNRVREEERFYNPDPVYVRNHQYHEKLFQQNDLFFIKFEELEIEVGDVEFTPELITQSWWDMIGMVDSVNVGTTAQGTDVVLQIAGRDFTKMFIDDNSYFNQVSLNHYGIGPTKSMPRTGRVGGEFFDWAAITTRTIYTSLNYIFHRISTIGYVPNEVFDMFPDLTEISTYKLPPDQNTGSSVSINRAMGMWRLVKFWIDENINDLRIVDSSISNPQGSIWDLMKAQCQQPFVELFTETLGNKLYVIARKPPFERRELENIVDEVERTPEEDFRLATASDMLSSQRANQAGRSLNSDNEILPANQETEYTTSNLTPFDRLYERDFVRDFGESNRKMPLIISIDEDDVLADNLIQTNTSFAWYNIELRGMVAGAGTTPENQMGVYFDEVAQVFGNNRLNVVSNYSDYRYWKLNDNSDEGGELRKDMFADQTAQQLAFLVETNIHLPFTREGSITINGDRRIKKGTYIYYKPTDELYYVDSVENNINISGGSVDRTTTIRMSRGMVLDYIKGKDEDIETEDGQTVTKNISYFNIVDIKKLDDKVYDIVAKGTVDEKFDYKSSMLIDMDVFNFFLKKQQYK